MTDPLEAEVRGDWANLKGAHYHLTYALWLLLNDQVGSFSLYDGNDLLARPLPVPDEPGDEGPLSGFAQQVGERDIWIQAKATVASWTPTELLSGRLLVNFMLNALRSRAECRQWEVRLVTTAPVTARESDVVAFAKRPTAKRVLNAALKQRLDDVRGALRQAGRPVPKADELRKLAFDVLRSLATTAPVPLSTLKAECERQVAYVYPNPGAVRTMLNALLGALLADGAKRPELEQPYGTTWLNEAAGRPLRGLGLLVDDPAQACDEAARTKWPRGWSPERHAPRTELQEALDTFVAAPQTVFVLVGESGTGKSAALVHWLTQDLSGWPRVYLDGSQWAQNQSLAQLCRAALQGQSYGTVAAEEVLQRLEALAVVHECRVTVVLDDVRPWPDTHAMSRRLEELVASCEQRGVKLVIGTTPDRWRAISSTVPESALFASNRERPGPSHLGDLTGAELEGFVVRTLGQDAGAARVAQLRLPEWGSLRRPAILTYYLAQLTNGEAGSVTPPTVDEVLGRHVKRVVRDGVGAESSCGPEVAWTAWQDLLRAMWGRRTEGLSYADAVKALDGATADEGKAMLLKLRDQGLLTLNGTVRFLDELVEAHCLAEMLRPTTPPDAWSATVQPSRDGLVVEAMLRMAPEQAFGRATLLLDNNPAWKRPVANGLAQAGADDWRSLALLTALVRPDGPDLYDADACRALGRLASRSERALAWLSVSFCAREWPERYRAAVALRETMSLAPAMVMPVVTRRVRWPVSDKERETWLDDALLPLFGAADAATARLAWDFTEREGQLRHARDDKVAEHLAGLRGHLCRYLGEERERIYADLDTDDLGRRRQAARAIEGLALARPLEVAELLANRLLSADTDDHLQASLWWALLRTAKAAPRATLQVLSRLPVDEPSTPWWMLAVALLAAGRAAAAEPTAARSLLADHLPQLDDAQRALLAETRAAAWREFETSTGDTADALPAMAGDTHPDADPWLRPYLLRGSLAAWLLLTLGERATAFDYVFIEPGGGHVGLFLQLLAADHSSALCELGHWDEFTSRVVDYVSSIAGAARLAEGGAPDYVFTPTREAADLLVMVAKEHPAPHDLIANVVPDWAALYATNELFKAGRFDDGLVEFARQLCERNSGGGTGNTIAARNECLEHLKRGANTPVWFAPSMTAKALAHAARREPGGFLAALETRAAGESIVPVLAQLHAEAATWPVVLIGRVFARMLEVEPISLAEAQALTEQLLIALDGLPDDERRQEWLGVFGAIAARLAGDEPEPPRAPTRQTLFAHDLRTALDLLASPTVDLQPALTRGVVGQSTNWIAKLTGLSHGFGANHYAEYALPATRLAAVAVDSSDPVGMYLANRHTLQELLNAHSTAFHTDWEPPAGARERAIAALAAQEAALGGDALYWSRRGHLQLLAGSYLAAEDDLCRATTRGLASPRESAGAWYDLACTQARLGKGHAARESLTIALDRLPELGNQLATDADFESLRAEAWFEALVHVACTDPPAEV